MFLGKKTEIREWETRMNNYLQTPGTNWEKVWQNLHNKINITYVKSALWEMYHLNFWSGYRAGEFCSLCKEYEEDITHILNSCSVLIEILRTFNIHNIFNTKIKRTFGTDDDPLTNFLLYHIKTVVFRSRFKTFISIDVGRNYVINKCKENIKNDIKLKFKLAKSRNKLEDFTKIFVPNIVGNANNQPTIINVTLIENNDVDINF